MKPISFYLQQKFLLGVGLCFVFGSTIFAQQDPTVSQFDRKHVKQRAPFKLAQQTEKPGAKSESSKTRIDQKKGDQKKSLPSVSPERRAELMKFLTSHHPELRPLLSSLNKRRPQQYQNALRTLDREIKNLQALEQRAPERYKKSLQQWVVKSNIKLLSAQLAIKTDAQEISKVQAQLDGLIAQQHQLRVEQVQADVDQARKRLEKLQAQLKTLDANRDKEIQKQKAVVQRNVERILAGQRKAKANKQSVNSGKTKVDPKKKKPNGKANSDQ